MLHNQRSRALIAMGALALTATFLTPALAAGASTVLISRSSPPVTTGNDESSEPNVSKTGQFVVFQSAADNLVADDTNGQYDCFLRDQTAGTTERVSLRNGGGQSNGDCWGPDVSADGRYVVFGSSASNLVAGDDNGQTDIFVRDRQAGTTVRVSVSSSGAQADGPSEDPAISADGTIIAFESEATNLVSRDTNGRLDVFVHDLTTGETKRVSVSSRGAQGNGASRDPDVSADGRWVAFDSNAGNLLARDKNGVRDVFLHDLDTGTTKLVSMSRAGKPGTASSSNATVNSNGRYVAFSSKARNLVTGKTTKGTDVFLRDMVKGKIWRISVSNSGKQGDGWSGDPVISNTGRYIAFESKAPNLVAKDTNNKWDVFLRDRIKKTTKIVSLTTTGARAKFGDSDDPAISGDGRFIAFESTAKNMFKNDNNGAEDIFRRGAMR